MKSLILIALVLTLPTHAKALEKLKVEKVGAYTFMISEANEVIHAQSPMVLQVSLIENTGLTQKDRFTLTLQGEMKFDAGHASVKQIQARYPDYKMVGSVASSRAVGCQVKLPDGSSVACELPPFSGNYVSALQVLSRAQGESLLQAIRRGVGLEIKVEVEESTPESVRFEKTTFHPSQVCSDLLAESQRVQKRTADRPHSGGALPSASLASVTLETLLVTSAKEVAAQLTLHGRTPSRGLLQRALKAAMSMCLEHGSQTPIESLDTVKTFSDLMIRRVFIRREFPSTPASIEVGFEELRYPLLKRQADLEVQYQVL
jgi:hypothetical protein